VTSYPEEIRKQYVK